MVSEHSMTSTGEFDAAQKLLKAADSAARLLERICLSWHPAFQKT